MSLQKKKEGHSAGVMYTGADSHGQNGESSGEMNCNLMVGSSEVWGIILVLKVISVY